MFMLIIIFYKQSLSIYLDKSTTYTISCFNIFLSLAGFRSATNNVLNAIEMLGDRISY